MLVLNLLVRQNEVLMQQNGEMRQDMQQVIMSGRQGPSAPLGHVTLNDIAMPLPQRSILPSGPPPKISLTHKRKRLLGQVCDYVSPLKLYLII